MNFAKKILPFAITVLVTVLVIYLTPLKNLNIIEPRINDIDPQEFYTDYSKNPDKYIFIDVRPKFVYDNEHAKGSINIELQNMYNERYNLPKHGKEIVLICTQGKASGVAYGYLEHYGFLNLTRIAGGIERWKAEGLPVEGKANKLGKTEVLSFDYQCPEDLKVI